MGCPSLQNRGWQHSCCCCSSCSPSSRGSFIAISSSCSSSRHGSFITRCCEAATTFINSSIRQEKIKGVHCFITTANVSLTIPITRSTAVVNKSNRRFVALSDPNNSSLTSYFCTIATLLLLIHILGCKWTTRQFLRNSRSNRRQYGDIKKRVWPAMLLPQLPSLQFHYFNRKKYSNRSGWGLAVAIDELEDVSLTSSGFPPLLCFFFWNFRMVTFVNWVVRRVRVVRARARWERRVLLPLPLLPLPLLP